MPTGPQKIILIRSGRYEYAEVEINGALQIVGPNNTGKTTLINTLQFLYIDDRRHMDFGSYTPEQTREFYFPNQYSYVLFECLGVQGTCVIGWHGQSKASGGEPERFCYLGPFTESDFLDERHQVREPRDVNARLAVDKQFRVLKSAQEHREALLVPANGEARGLGVVALRDTDKYHQFRETLKCLLTLSAITQEQMRDRLLMLADIPPDRTALDVRALFGDDYDRIRERRDRLVRFKKNQALVERFVEKFAQREAIRGELICRWTDLRAKRQAFEKTHEATLETLRAEAKTQAETLAELSAELSDRRNDVTSFSRQEGGLTTQLDALAKLDQEFANFVDDFERAALANLETEIRALDNQLASSQNESREKATQKIVGCTGLVKQAEQTIARFDNLAVTALRKHFNDDELNTIFRVLSRDLLEIPVGSDGIQVARQRDLITALRQLLLRISDGIYEDGNLTIKLPTHTLPLAGLENVETAREHLEEHRQTLQRWQNTLAAIEQRESIQRKLKAKREARDGKRGPSGEEVQEGLVKRIFRFEEHQKAKLGEPRLRAELKAVTKTIATTTERIKALEVQSHTAEKAEECAKGAIRKAENEFNQVMGRFGDCICPEFAAKAQTVEDIPNDFDAAISLFLRQQSKQVSLADETALQLAELERWFGDEFRGDDEQETIRLLREELEALADKEEALARDWNAHIHGLKATFDRVLRELGEVQSAKDDLNRQFAKVPVSNLKSVRMEVIEQTDLVSWIRRLASFEPGGLFDHDPERESALVNFRTILQANPVVRFAGLFTLGVTVEGPDGRKHTYHDFRQIESHGTTVAIKVLFNLLLLKSQLKRDDCQVPFFLDEVQILDPANRHAILATARKLGFLAITAAPEAVSEVDALYFLQPRRGWIVLRNKHRVGLKTRPRKP
jgi:energy-coupling factor transporter ATP-binding protein EcfA2